jgi:hypothetical protein
MSARFRFATRNLMDPYQPLKGDEVSILAEDGRAAYSIRILPDGSLNVRAAFTHQRDGVLYADRLIVKPICCNSVDIDCEVYK